MIGPATLFILEYCEIKYLACVPLCPCEILTVDTGLAMPG